MKDKEFPLLDLLEREDSTEIPDRLTSSVRIFVSNSLDFDKKQSIIIKKFVSFCYNALNLKESYKCILVDDREKFKILTTAACNFDTNHFKVYCKGRSISDILRSISHEMSHLKQHESGLYPIQDIGKKPHHQDEKEFQANAMAGSLVSIFANKIGRNKVYEN